MIVQTPPLIQAARPAFFSLLSAENDALNCFLKSVEVDRRRRALFERFVPIPNAVPVT